MVRDKITTGLEAVDIAVRTLVGEPMSTQEALAMFGVEVTA